MKSGYTEDSNEWRESCNHKKLVKAVSIDKFPLKISCWVS